MRRVIWMLTATLLVSCGPNEHDDAHGDDDDATGDCEVEVLGTVPANDAMDAYHRAAVEFVLSAADATATAVLADGEGNPVQGTSEIDGIGTVLRFFPDEPLAPSSPYAATATTCDGLRTHEIIFTTSELGGPMDCNPTAGVYALDLDNARFLQPVGIGEVLQEMLSREVLMMFSSDTPPMLSPMWGMTVEDSKDQDFCTPTLDFPDVDFAEPPYFEMGPADAVLGAGAGSVPVAGLEFTGTFSPECSYIGGGAIAGEVDLRELKEALPGLFDAQTVDDLAGLLVGFGISTVPCPDAEAYCIDVLADQIQATLAGTPLECVPAENCHPNCPDSDSNPECDVDDYPTCE